MTPEGQGHGGSGLLVGLVLHFLDALLEDRLDSYGLECGGLL